MTCGGHEKKVESRMMSECQGLDNGSMEIYLPRQGREEEVLEKAEALGFTRFL